MRGLTYPMSVSLDGYIVGPDGDFDRSMPDEVLRFWIDEIREVVVPPVGRRLYETMLYWVIADQDPALGDAELERVDPELVETRTFSSRVVYLRYRVARQP
jgi:hypothetical protein